MNAEQMEQVASPVDFDDLVDRCLGNLEFVERLLTKFHQRFGEQLEELEIASAEQDAERVALVAHRLRGESASIAAPGLSERAAEIERLGRANRVADVAGSLDALRAEWAAFTEFLSALDE
jgi:HPt (histidine-containing phosphotransfer) domain-containing protein